MLRRTLGQFWASRQARLAFFAGVWMAPLIACSDGPCDEFVEAQEALVQTMSKTGDPGYGHPDFDRVEALFRAVPDDEDEYETAQQVAAQIRVARARYETHRTELEARRKQTQQVAGDAERRAHADWQKAQARDRFRRQGGGDQGPAEDEEKAEAVGRLDRVLSMEKDRVERAERHNAERKANVDRHLNKLQND